MRIKKIGIIILISLILSVITLFAFYFLVNNTYTPCKDLHNVPNYLNVNCLDNGERGYPLPVSDGISLFSKGIFFNLIIYSFFYVPTLSLIYFFINFLKNRTKGNK